MGLLGFLNSYGNLQEENSNLQLLQSPGKKPLACSCLRQADLANKGLMSRVPGSSPGSPTERGWKCPALGQKPQSSDVE